MRAHLLAPTSRTDVARRYRYVFVVTYGRSGSTLLMGLLNTIPGYRIRGENQNVLYRLYQADTALREAYDGHADNPDMTPSHPWYGATSWRPDAFRRGLLDGFVANVLRPTPGDRVLGFKEIRYTKSHIPDLPDYLGFLRSALSGSKIIFNHRRPADVARSGWWADVPKALERIQAADERLLAVPADNRHHHFFFDDIDEDLDNIRALFRFLGEEVDEERIRHTLGQRHSYSPNDGQRPPPMRRLRHPIKLARRLAWRASRAARLR